VSKPKDDSSVMPTIDSSGCPVEPAARASFWKAWLEADKNNNTVESPTVPSTENAAAYAQTPRPDQRYPMSTERQVSSIPRGGNGNSSPELIPHHQLSTPSLSNNNNNNNNNNWIYPSEQQFYNAIRRKGYNNIPETSIPMVIRIHNNTNERTWREIQQWEYSSRISLEKFTGRPNDKTPKAVLWSLFGADAPFDRHDWYVCNSTSNTRQRYVIDYYENTSSEKGGMYAKAHMDVRPALDDARSLFLWARYLVRTTYPNICARLLPPMDTAPPSKKDNTK
jgi:cytochrome c heme-lyase